MRAIRLRSADMFMFYLVYLVSTIGIGGRQIKCKGEPVSFYESVLFIKTCLKLSLLFDIYQCTAMVNCSNSIVYIRLGTTASVELLKQK